MKRRAGALTPFVGPFLLMLAWLACAIFSYYVARQGTGLALIWPGNAVVTAVLLLCPKERRATYLLAVAIVAVAFNFYTGRSPLASAGFAVLGLIEAVIATWLIARLSPADRLFDVPVNIFRFALAAILACIPSAVIAGFVFATSFNLPWWQIAIGWMPPHGCGLLIITPLILILHKYRHSLHPGDVPLQTAVRGLMWLGLVAGMTALIFQQSSYGLAFLTVPALLIATYHMRAPGAAVSVVIIAVISSHYMMNGFGPFALMRVSMAERVYVMELFIATMFLCALPLAAVLDERDKLAAETAGHLFNLRAIAERIGDVLFRIDEDNRWSYLNPAFQAVTGQAVADGLGRSIFDHLPSRDHSRVRHAIEKLRTDGMRQFSFSTIIVNAGGSPRHVEFVLNAPTLDGMRRGVTGIFRDVTARRLLDDQLRQNAVNARRAAAESEAIARTDELTGLPNRRAFFERLEMRISAGVEVALAVFDVDHFKRINDSHGHPTGDAVLRRIAETASEQLRSGDFIARIGGEEFAVIFDNMSAAGAEHAAQRVIAAVAGDRTPIPAALAGGSKDLVLQATISMGLALLRPGQNGTQLLSDADRALYIAKNAGRNRLSLAA